MVKSIATFNTIAKEGESLFKDKGSKFFGYAYRVSTEGEIKILLEELKKLHHNARHFCYAYKINPKQIYERANDDGEPKHSAGTPILGQLNSSEIVNVLIVVVRYFGGTKLGIPGLINAYKTAAKEAIENAGIIVEEITANIKVTFDYAEMNQIMRILKQNSAIIYKRNLEVAATFYIRIREDRLKQIEETLLTIKSVNFTLL